MPEEEKGFQINDRRKAFSEGEEKQEKKTEEPRREEPREEHRHEHEHEHEHGEMPPVDFISFISSLAATAFLHLGDKFSPDQPDDMKDLVAAKQMIDLLGLLDEKTKGNLTQEESQMMESILYSLRMRYVRETTGR